MTTTVVRPVHAVISRAAISHNSKGEKNPAIYRSHGLILNYSQPPLKPSLIQDAYLMA
jgi:hypothetical protein